MPDFVEVSVFARNGTERLIAKVSPEDADRVLAYRWIARRERNTTYARMSFSHCGRGESPTMMHRFILGLGRGGAVDHVNTDGLDNRRCNIRGCTHSENLAAMPARSICGYKGVTFTSDGWVASFTENRMRYRIGAFDTAEEAARAVDQEAIARYGDMAWLNFTDRAQAPRIVPVNHSYIQTCDKALVEYKRDRVALASVVAMQPPAYRPSDAAPGTRAWALWKAGITPTPDGL